MFINLNLANDGALESVFPAAQAAGMAVIVRECFMKGELFHAGDEVGLIDRARLAQAALKWNLLQEGVTIAVVGAQDRSQMRSNLRVLEDLSLNSEDRDIIERLRESDHFQGYRKARRKQFFEIE
jgi:aryl-alcohol dehydrogenase-like predicted oxidoreductase